MRKQDKQNFSIIAVEAEEGMIDVTSEVHCDTRFLKNVVVQFLLDLNSRLNDNPDFVIKNGFWLDVRDSIDLALKKKAGIK